MRNPKEAYEYWIESRQKPWVKKEVEISSNVGGKVRIFEELANQ